MVSLINGIIILAPATVAIILVTLQARYLLIDSYILTVGITSSVILLLLYNRHCANFRYPKLFLAVFVCCLFSTTISCARVYSIAEFLFIVSGMLLLCCPYRTSIDGTTRSYFLQILALVGVVVATNGILEWLDSMPNYSPSVSSTLRNANPLAGYLIMMIGVWLSLSFSNLTRYSTMLNLASLTIGIACLILTGSRMTWLIFIFSIPMYLLFSGYSRQAVVVRLLTSLLVACVLVSILSGSASKLWSSSGTQIKQLEQGEDELSIWVRLGYYKDAIRIAGMKPFSGTGPGTFRHIYSHEASHPYYSVFVHSMPLQYLAEIGYPFILLYLLLIGLVLFNSIKYGKVHSPIESTVAIGGICFLVHCLVNVSWSIHPVSMTFLFIAGLFSGSNPISNPTRRFTLSKNSLPILIISLSLVLSYVSLQIVGYRLLSKGQRLQNMNRYSEAQRILYVAYKLMPFHDMTCAYLSWNQLKLSQMHPGIYQDTLFQSDTLKLAKECILRNPSSLRNYAHLLSIQVKLGLMKDAKRTLTSAKAKFSNHSFNEDQLISMEKTLIIAQRQ